MSRLKTPSLIILSAACALACRGGSCATPSAADAATDASAPDGGTDAATPDASTPDGGSTFAGLDCPPPGPSTVPASSPRVLIIGPGTEAARVGSHLQGLLATDPAFDAPVVTVVDSDTSNAGDPTIGGQSLMSFFYLPAGRDARLAPLSLPWTWVVLLEPRSFVLRSPQLHFEGVRVLACRARAAGAKPVLLMNWSYPTPPGIPSRDVRVLADTAWRIGAGTGTVVAPAGTAWETAAPWPVTGWGTDDVFVAAATLYSTLTGRDAANSPYAPAGIGPAEATRLATSAHATVAAEATAVHYDAPYRGAVELRSMPDGGELCFMASGSSSEQIWVDRMNEVLPRVGLTPRGVHIGFTTPSKTFEEATLAVAQGSFALRQYQVLLARDYSVDAARIVDAGAQPELQVEVWDRHADADPSDGVETVGRLEFMLGEKYGQATALGLALVPYHLMFARLKTMRPSVQVTSDGVHATYAVGFGLATMSVVSRTGLHVPTDGLDADTQLAARLAEETVRQLATLSASGAHVPDDPATRPRAW